MDAVNISPAKKNPRGKAVSAFYDARKKCFEDRINAEKEKLELEMKTSIEENEKKMVYEDLKYTSFEEENSQLKEDIEKKIEMIKEAHTTRMEVVTDDFNKSMKEKEDVYANFKKKFDEETRLISIEIDEIDDQYDREVIMLEVGFGPKVKKVTAQHVKVQKEIKNYKAKISSTQKIEGEIEMLNVKYREDIEKFKSNVKVLDEKIAVKDKEIEDCDKILRDKNNWIDAEELKIINTEKEIFKAQSTEEKEKEIGKPLRKKLAMTTALNFIWQEVTQIDQEMRIIELESTDLKQKIQSIKKKIKNMDKIIRANEASTRKIKVDLMFMYLQEDQNVEKIQEYLSGLSQKYENSDREVNQFRQRRSLEQCLSHLEERKMTVSKRNLTVGKKCKENSTLAMVLIKYQNEESINKEKYNQLLSVIEKSDRKTSGWR